MHSYFNLILLLIIYSYLKPMNALKNANAKPSLGERMYSNAKNVIGHQAGQLGRFSAYLSFGGAFVLALVLIGIAVFLFMRKPKQTEETTATLVQAECENKGITDSKGTTQNSVQCMLKYSFEAIDGKTYQPTQFVQGNNWYQEDQMVPIRYDPQNPYDSSLRSWGTPARVGWILIGIAVLILLAAGIHLYMVLAFPIAASAQGVGTAAGVFGNAMRG